MINWPSAQPSLVDGNLTLRPWKAEDLEFVFKSCQDEEIQLFTTVPIPYTKQDAANFISSRSAGFKDKLTMSFVGEISGEPALSVSLHHVNIFDHLTEIGYWVNPKFRGQKLAGKATQLLSDYAIDIGFRRIEAHTLPENYGSQKSLLAAGFELETVLKSRLTARDSSQSDGVQFVKFATS